MSVHKKTGCTAPFTQLNRVPLLYSTRFTAAQMYCFTAVLHRTVTFYTSADVILLDILFKIASYPRR